MNKLKKAIFIILILFIITIFVAIIFNINRNSNDDNDKVDDVVLIDEEKIDNNSESFDDYKEIWNTNYSINDDYVGEIIFDSGIITESFVCAKKDMSSYVIYDNYAKVVSDYENGCESGQCSLNDAYLRVDWKTKKYNLGGSIFMDYRNTINDQNLILYGHHYPSSMKDSQDLFFTPLAKLLSKDNYEENKTFKLILNNEIRHYEIVYVYIFANNEEAYENLQFFRTNYNEDYDGNVDDYYSTYIKNVEKVKLYDTGLSLSTSDNTVTLQTCLDNQNNGVEIVVAREIKQ